jgi:hypothetical protein
LSHFVTHFDCQLLQTHDYNDATWQPVELLPMLPAVTAPAFIQSGYFDFMVQVAWFIQA